MSILDENFAYALVSSSDRTLKITGVNIAKYHAGNANWGSFPAIPELYAGSTPAYNGYGAPENAFVVVEITSGAFNGRTEFAEGTLVLPKTLLRIGDNAFKGVKITGRLTIPASVTSIGANAFDNTLIDELLVENAALTDLLSGVVDATRVTSKEIAARAATDTALTELKVTKAEPVFTGTTTIATAAVSEMKVSSHATVQTANIATGSVTNTATVDYYEPNVSEKNKNARFRVLTTAGNLLSVGGVNENLVPIEVVLTNGTYRTGAALVAALVTALNAKNIAWVGGPPMQTISWINTSFDATTGKVKLGYSTDAPGSLEPSIVIRTKFASNGVSYNSSSLLGAVSANIGGSDEPGAFIVTYGNRFGLSFPQAINLGTPMLNVNGDAKLAGSGTVNGNWNFIGNKPRYNAEVLATESFTLSKIQAINGTSLLSTVKTLADVASAIGADPQFAVNVQTAQSAILQSVVSLASVRSTEVSSLSSALSSKVSALQSTDASLSSAISGAVPVRVSQVESVSAVLQTAVSQMQSADVSISTALSTATSQRSTQTLSLNSAISTTASLMQNADTALSTGLSTATLTRSVNISTKSSMWSAHVSVLQTVDASLSTALVGAASSRSSAVSSLESLVSTTVPGLAAGNTTIQTAISTATTNRVASIVSVTNAISTQISTAQSLNAVLLPQITAAASTAPAATTNTVFNLVGINVNDVLTFRMSGGSGGFATGNKISITYSPTDFLKGTVTAVSGSDITFQVTQKATSATETTVYATTGAFGVSTASSSGSHVVPLTSPAFVAVGSNYVITSMTGALFSSTHSNHYTVSLLDASDATLATAPSQFFNALQTPQTHAFTTAFVLKGAANLKQKFSHAAGASTQIVINSTDSGAFTTMKGYAVNYSSGSVFIESNGALQSTRISAVGALSTSALDQVGSLSTVVSANRSGIALQTSERTASIESIMSATGQSVTSLQAVTSAHGSAVSVAVSTRNSDVSSLTSSINASVSSLSSLVTSISGAVSAQIVNRSTQVLTAVTSLVGAAPASLDTLFEIAATLDAGPTLYSTLDSTETSRETLMATSDTATNLTVTGAGTEYVINGVSKPVLTLIRGNRYTLTVGAGGHPFYFQTSGLSYNASLVYSPTGPIVTGIATQYAVVGTGVGASGNWFANYIWQVSGNYVRYADYRLRFSNGVISDLIITPNRVSQGSLVNPDISFALTNIPAIGVTAILQGRNSDLPENGWFDVNVPTRAITPGTTTIKFGGASGTSFFAATPIISTATIVFDVPNDAPDTLTYVSQDKPNMGNTVNVSTNTRIREVASVSISLSAAASTLQLADASLSVGISSAVSVRTSQAASVSSGVSTVISSARSTQSATSAGISSTVSLRASGVASISTALAALSTAAQLSDLSAGGSITTAISARQSGTSSMSTVLSTSVSGFESVGVALSSTVSTATSVRQSGTASVSTALSTAVSGQHQTLVSLASVQSALSAGINVSALANLSDVNSAIEALVGVGAVTTLDTLNELATAISNDATVGTTLIGLLNEKATQSEVAALGSAVLLKASQADLTQLVSTVGTKVGDASVTQLESAVTSMTVVTTSVSSQVQILQTNMAASSQTIGLLSDIIRQIDTLYEYIGSVDANGSIIYAVNKLADMVLVSSSLVFTINPTTYAVSKVAQLAVVRFDPTQTSFTYSNRGIGPIPVSLPSGTHTHTFSIDSSSATDYTNNATSIVITADPTALRTAPANSPFTVPKLALSGYTYATPTVVTPYDATTWSDATGKTSRVITINFESGVQHLEVGGMVYAVAGTTQYVHTLEYLPGATGTLVIKALNSATKLESASLSLSDVYTDYPQHAAPAEVGGSKTVTVSGSTYTLSVTYATTASTVEVYDYDTQTSAYSAVATSVPVVGGQVSVSRSYLIGQAGQPLFQLRAKTGDGKRSGTFVVATAEAITFIKPTLTPVHDDLPVNPVYTTLSAGSYRATFTYTVHPLATQVRVINPSTAGTYITSQAASGGSVTFSIDYTEAQSASISIAVITLANSAGLQSVASDTFVPLGQYDPPVQVAGSKTVTLSSGTYTHTAQYTSASPDGIIVYGADGVTLIGSSTSTPFTVTVTYAADKFGQTVALLSSKGTASKRESEKTTSVVGEDIPTHAAPVISGGITYGTSGANYTAQMNYSVTSNVDTLRVLNADQTELSAGSTSVQQSIVSTTGATRVISVTVTFSDAVAPLNIVVVAEANPYSKQSVESDIQSLLGVHATPIKASEPTYTLVSAGSYTASMTYTVVAGVTAVQVRKASDNSVISDATSSVSSTTATITVPFTDAGSPLSIVVVALANSAGRVSAASVTQTLLKRFTAPTKATDPVYTTVSAGSYTASMTYNVVDSGVTAVQVRKASDNSVVSGVTSSINSLIATITVPFTDADLPLNIVVVALANSAGRESAPSATQALVGSHAAPTTSAKTVTSSTTTYSISNPANRTHATTFPYLGGLSSWTMSIYFRCTSANIWRALAGSLYYNSSGNTFNWGLWVHPTRNMVTWSWAAGAVIDTSLAVAINVDYHLRITKTTTTIRFELTNVGTGVTVSETANHTNMSMGINGPVTIGGWINTASESGQTIIAGVHVGTYALAANYITPSTAGIKTYRSSDVLIGTVTTPGSGTFNATTPEYDGGQIGQAVMKVSAAADATKRESARLVVNGEDTPTYAVPVLSGAISYTGTNAAAFANATYTVEPNVTTVSVYSKPTGPIVTGIATQFASATVGTGATSSGLIYANWASTTPGVHVAHYRLRFSNGMVSNLSIYSDSPQGLTNPTIRFALSNIPASGVTAILQGRNNAYAGNVWYDVNVPTRFITPSDTIIDIGGTTNQFAASPAITGDTVMVASATVTTPGTIALAIPYTFSDVGVGQTFYVVANANTRAKQSAASVAQILVGAVKVSEPVYTLVTASMNYAVASGSGVVTSVEVRRASDNTIVSGATHSISSLTASITVPFTDADSPFNFVVVAKINSSLLPASAPQTLLKQYVAPTFNSVTYSGNTATMTYTVESGVTAVELRKASDNSVISTGVTSSVSGTTATINVTFTENVTIVVVAVGNLSGRESAASIAETLISLAPELRYSGTFPTNDYTATRNTTTGLTSLINGIAVDASANVYLSSQSGNKIAVYNANDQIVTSFGSSGAGNGQFNQPGAVAIDALGNVVVVDSANNRIQMFTKDGTHIRSFGSAGTGDGQFQAASGLTIDANNNIYVSDSTRNNVQKFTNSGVFISKFGSAGSGNGQFNLAANMAIDESGNIYIVDTNNYRVQVFDKLHNYISQKTFTDKPQEITIDASDTIFVAFDKHTISIHDMNWDRIDYFGFNGSGVGQFNLITGLVVDKNGTLFVADRINNRFQAFGTSPQPTVGQILSTPVMVSGPTYQNVTGTNETVQFTFEMDLGVSAIKLSQYNDALQRWDPLTIVVPVSVTYQNTSKTLVTVEVPVIPFSLGVTALSTYTKYQSLISAAVQIIASAFTAPTLTTNSLTYSGNTANMTYDVATGVTHVEVRNATTNAVIPSTTSVNTTNKTASVSVTYTTENVSIVVVALGNLSGRESAPSASLIVGENRFPAPVRGTISSEITNNVHMTTIQYTVVSGVITIQTNTASATWSLSGTTATVVFPTETTLSISVSSLGNGTYATSLPNTYTRTTIPKIQISGYDGSVSSTVAHNATFGSSGTGDFGFNAPRGIAHLYVNTGTASVPVIRKFLFVSNSGGNNVKVYSNASSNVASLNFHSAIGSLANPCQIACHHRNDSSGVPIRMAFADSGNNRIVTYNNLAVDANGVLTIGVSANLGVFGSGVPTATTDAPQFHNPQGVAYTRSGFMVVADTNNHRIHRFASTNRYPNLTSSLWGTNGTGLGQLNFPMSIAVNADENVIVGCNNGVQMFTGSGTFLTKISTIVTPNVAVDNAGVGKIIVSNPTLNQVQVFSSGGALITTFGGSGSTNGLFNTASGVTVDDFGNIYVCDRGNNRIQYFESVPAGSFAAPVLSSVTYSGTTATMTYTVASDVNAVEVQKSSDRTVISDTTFLIVGTTATITVPFMDNAVAPLDIVVVALTNPGFGLQSPASAVLRLVGVFAVPIKASGPTYTSTSAESYTANMTYTVASGVTAVQVRNASDNSVLTTTSVSGTIATISVTIAASVSIVVVAVGNPDVGRESEASVAQPLTYAELLLNANGVTIQYTGSAALVPTSTPLYIYANPTGSGMQWYAVVKHKNGISTSLTPPGQSSPVLLNNVVTTLITDLSGFFNNRDNMFGKYLINGKYSYINHISRWDTSNVTTMASMFKDNSTFDHYYSIQAWNTANVTNMYEMFMNANNFSGNITSWNTAKVNNMSRMFFGATGFSSAIGGWNTSAVMSMQEMFYEARVFNQPIGSWNTSAVNNMFGMFSDAVAFNQPIGTWNTAAVNDMTVMFFNATAFNQNISSWVINGTNLSNTSLFGKGSGIISYDLVPPEFRNQVKFG